MVQGGQSHPTCISASGTPIAGMTINISIPLIRGAQKTRLGGLVKLSPRAFFFLVLVVAPFMAGLGLFWPIE